MTAYSLLLINTLVWGAAFIVVKPAFDVITPFNFLFTRFLLATILCLPMLVHFFRTLKITRKMLLTIVLLELVGTTLNLALLYLGLARTSAIETSLISTTAPLFTVVLGILILKEKQEKNEWLGSVLSFSGMILITLLPSIHKSSDLESSSLGNFLIVSAIISESLYFIAAKKYYKKIPKLFVASISFIVGTIGFGLLAWWQSQWSAGTLFSELQLNFQDTSVIFAVVYMAVFGSIIGLTTYIRGQNMIEASEASIFRYLQPLVYLPLGVLALGESMQTVQWVGLGLILFGFVVAELRRSK